MTHEERAIRLFRYVSEEPASKPDSFLLREHPKTIGHFIEEYAAVEREALERAAVIADRKAADWRPRGLSFSECTTPLDMTAETASRTCSNLAKHFRALAAQGRDDGQQGSK